MAGIKYHNDKFFKSCSEDEYFKKWFEVLSAQKKSTAGCGTKLTGVQVHQIMPDTRTF
jgi:hypothetical protein